MSVPSTNPEPVVYLTCTACCRWPLAVRSTRVVKLSSPDCGAGEPVSAVPRRGPWTDSSTGPAGSSDSLSAACQPASAQHWCWVSCSQTSFRSSTDQPPPTSSDGWTGCLWSALWRAGGKRSREPVILIGLWRGSWLLLTLDDWITRPGALSAGVIRMRPAHTCCASAA
jgi:hypothetical protein